MTGKEGIMAESEKKYEIEEAVTVWAHDAAYGAVLQMYPWKGDEEKFGDWSNFAAEVAISAVESEMVSEAIKERRFGRAIRFSSGIAVAAGLSMLEEITEEVGEELNPLARFSEYIKKHGSKND